MTKWQDISTAPKDGTVVDLWVIRTHESGGTDQKRRPNCSWGKMADCLTGEVYEGWRGLSDPYADIKPTHWIFIPPTPKGKGE